MITQLIPIQTISKDLRISFRELLVHLKKEQIDCYIEKPYNSLVFELIDPEKNKDSLRGGPLIYSENKAKKNKIRPDIAHLKLEHIHLDRLIASGNTLACGFFCALSQHHHSDGIPYFEITCLSRILNLKFFTFEANQYPFPIPIPFGEPLKFKVYPEDILINNSDLKKFNTNNTSHDSQLDVIGEGYAQLLNQNKVPITILSINELSTCFHQQSTIPNSTKFISTFLTRNPHKFKNLTDDFKKSLNSLVFRNNKNKSGRHKPQLLYSHTNLIAQENTESYNSSRHTSLSLKLINQALSIYKVTENNQLQVVEFLVECNFTIKEITLITRVILAPKKGEKHELVIKSQSEECMRKKIEKSALDSNFSDYAKSLIKNHFSKTIT